jgi:hypothetical protein
MQYNGSQHNNTMAIDAKVFEGIKDLEKVHEVWRKLV